MRTSKERMTGTMIHNSGLRLALGLLSSLLLQPEALAGDVQDVTVMQEAVEKGGGQRRVRQVVSPLSHALVGGDQNRAALVARVHYGKEHVRLARSHGQVAHLVDDEE